MAHRKICSASLICASVFIAKLSVLSALADSIDWNRERLFFTPEERNTRDKRETPVALNDEQTSITFPDSVKILKNEKSDIAIQEKNKPTEALLTFSTILGISGSYTLIINERPCKLKARRNTAKTFAKKVICRGMSGRYPEMFFDEANESLIVHHLNNPPVILTIGKTY